MHLRLLILCACLLINSCGQPPSPLRVGISPWPGYEYVYLAEKLGYFRKVGLDLQLLDFQSLADTRYALTKGRIDIAALTTGELMLAKEVDPSLVAFYILEVSHGADVIVANSNIGSLQDLAGKTVGFEAGTFDIALLSAAMRHAGMDIGDVSLINLPKEKAAQAMQDHTIDACTSFMPFLRELLDLADTHIIFDTTQTPNTLIDVLATQEQLTDTRQKDFKKIIEAIEAAKDYARKHPQEIYPLMAKRLNITEDDLEYTLERLIFPTLPEQKKWLSNNATLDHMINPLKADLQNLNLIKADYPATAYFANAVFE